jgi:hypothetical protein
MCLVISFDTLIPLSLALVSLLAFETQHWRPPFVSLKKHPQNATQKETRKGAFGRRHIPSGRRESPHHHSNNYPDHSHTTNTPPTAIHKVPRSNHRPNGATNRPSRGACDEHLSSKHRASTPAPTPNHRSPRGPVTRLRRRNQSSH